MVKNIGNEDLGEVVFLCSGVLYSVSLSIGAHRRVIPTIKQYDSSSDSTMHLLLLIAHAYNYYDPLT